MVAKHKKGDNTLRNALTALLTLFFLAGPIFAAVPGLDGSYTLHSSIGGTDTEQTCTIAQKEAKLTGTCKSDTGEVKLTGTVDGKKVTMKFNTEYNGEPLTVTYTGTLNDSGSIKGDADVEPMGVTGDFTMTPIKPAPTPK